MISIVNGYVCNNCSEAADARKGKNPHAKPGELPYSSDKDNRISAFAGQPATLVDGALKDLLNAKSVTAARASGASLQTGVKSPRSGIDLLI